ncbi:hypothetical protein P3T18_000379 [Paraburkholderia sp. GAS199]|uniref:DUF1993 domain-containing protein n=1 Tax=Paraburkholderia sp. GAS199 TaxID=3035126 RepID=UPI003D262192
MYAQAIAQCAQALNQVTKYLDKAERYADEKKFDVGVLMSSRLAPDMTPFIYQIQSACDYLKAGAAWLSGQKPPRHEDNERSIEEVRARIQKTIDFVESVTVEQYAGAANERVKVSWIPGRVIPGERYLLQITIPNVYFHVGMAYAILRNNGVDVGKMDFLGAIDSIEA